MKAKRAADAPSVHMSELTETLEITP